MIETGLVATGMQGFWVRAVIGLVFLTAVVFHLTMDQPQRLQLPPPGPTSTAGRGTIVGIIRRLQKRPAFS
jgi:hypothetical protein